MCLPAPALPLPRPSPPGPGLPFALALARTAETTCSTEVRNCAAAVEIEWAMRDVADLPLAADAAWSLAGASATISPITSETSGKYFIACPLRCHIRILWSEAASNAACFCSSPCCLTAMDGLDGQNDLFRKNRRISEQGAHNSPNGRTPTKDRPATQKNKGRGHDGGLSACRRRKNPEKSPLGVRSSGRFCK